MARTAAGALCNIAADRPSVKRRAGECGAPQRLVVALRRHGADAAVQRNCCAALAVLVAPQETVACCCMPAIDSSQLQAAARAGACEAVVQVRYHSQSRLSEKRSV